MWSVSRLLGGGSIAGRIEQHKAQALARGLVPARRLKVGHAVLHRHRLAQARRRGLPAVPSELSDVNHAGVSKREGVHAAMQEQMAQQNLLVSWASA